MRFLKTFVILLFIVSLIVFFSYQYFFLSTSDSSNQFYQVESPSKKDIRQEVSTSGVLKLKDLIKIESDITGRVKKIYIEENDSVTEGQLLVEIDTGWGDAEVREAQGAYEHALAEFEYQEANYQLQKQLFQDQFIPEISLHEAKRNYQTALADVKTLKASYDKALTVYQNQSIYAPFSGVVIQVNAAQGDKVSSDSEGESLLLLVPDIKQIEAEIEISEKDIGQIQKGQKIQITVDTYPNKIFESTIQSISFTAKEEGEECIYEAKALVDNSDLLLRPGMNINAAIDIASAESCLALTSRSFIIKEEHLQSLANLLNFTIQPISKEDKEIVLNTHDQNKQFVWQVCNNCFQEIPVDVGITDHIYFQIKSGLTGDEKLVVEVLEEDEMQKLYEKFYRKL